MDMTEAMATFASWLGLAVMVTGGLVIYALLFAFAMDKLTTALRIKRAVIGWWFLGRQERAKRQAQPTEAE